MASLRYFLLFCFALLLTGCYSSMSGTVVDAESGKPIEGAVIAVQWTVTKGCPGLTYGKYYKINEAVSDKDGRFTVSGTMNPHVNPPTIVIYKRGYVAWRNDYIFPSYEKRDYVRWMDGQEFRLAKFSKEYSHDQHILFLPPGFDSNTAQRLREVTEWEEPLAQQERKIFNVLSRHMRDSGFSEADIWKEVMKKIFACEAEQP